MEEQKFNRIPLPGEEDVNLQNSQEKTNSDEEYRIYLAKYDLNDLSSHGESMDEQKRILSDSIITTKTKLKPVETLLSVGGVSIIERNDIYGTKGDPKSGKTTFNSVLITAALNGSFCNVEASTKNLKIIYLDTEQKPQDTHRILNRVKTMCGDLSDDYIDNHFRIVTLRKRNYTTLTHDLLRLVTDFRPDLIIADGIADFVDSINNEETSNLLIHRMLCIVEDFNCAIINMIHENKAYGDHNAKGHTGQILTQKAAAIFETQKTSGDIIKVKCTESRHKSMPDIFLMYDEQGFICDAREAYAIAKKEAASKKTAEYEAMAIAIIKEVGGRIKRADLATKMAEKSGKDRTWMSTQITNLLGKKLFEVNGMVQTSNQTEINF